MLIFTFIFLTSSLPHTHVVCVRSDYPPKGKGSAVVATETGWTGVVFRRSDSISVVVNDHRRTFRPSHTLRHEKRRTRTAPDVP